jgi:hypothetical protein
MNEDWRARWVAMHKARAAGRSVKDIAAEYKIGVVRVRQLLKKKTWAADRLRCSWAERTHCKNGHEFTEDNIYRAPGSPNVRCCRQCQLINRANKNQYRWTSCFIQDHDLDGMPFVDMRIIRHRVDLSDLSEPHLSAVKESLERYDKPAGK